MGYHILKTGSGNVMVQLIRYQAAGGAIFVLGYLQYNGIYNLLPVSGFKAAAAWFLNYLIGTFWSHAIHRRFTFRSCSRIPYWQSLLKIYLSYAWIHLFGCAAICLLCDVAHLDPRPSWALVTILTSGFNFIALRHYSICPKEPAASCISQTSL